LTSQKGDPEQIVRLQSVNIEDVKWNGPIVNHITSSAEKDNVLGLDFLTRFHVTFNLSANQMYLEPDPEYRDDTLTWLGTGFNVTPESGRRPKVLGIMVPSPASEAGLHVGDEIVEFNGRPTSTTSLATIFNETKRFEGAVVKLKIQREGEGKPRQFTLKMRRLL
jgi:membrane-associated protease RseP (regulator of RpoE activity)